MANLRVNKITGTEVFETTGSVQFDGNGDFLSLASSSDFAMGTGDFTVEFWTYPTARSTYEPYFIVTATGGLWIGKNQNNFVLRAFNVADFIQVSTLPELNTWTHIAVTRFNSVAKIFYNGIEVGSSSNTYDFIESSVRIANDTSTNYYVNGHISNLRILKGTALYTKNFTPPTRELTVIPNTVLLACTSSTRANEEKTGKTITVNGNAVANELTPGLLTDRVKSGGTSAIAGSVEFGPTGNALTVPAGTDFAYGTGDFTIECWINVSSFLALGRVIFSQTIAGTNYFLVLIGSNGEIQFYGTLSGGGTAINGPANISANSWNHIAITRSSNTVRVFVNGVSGTPTANSTDFSNTTYVPTIGNYTHNYTQVPFQGFISNLRILKGTALYTSNFTPPTRELKKIPNTVLLCCKDSSNPTAEETGKTITPYGSLVYNPPELVVDGEFNSASSWPSAGADWSISGGKATINSANSGYDFLGILTNRTTNGLLYELRFDITNWTAGRLELSQSDSSNVGVTVSGNGSYTFRFRYTGTTNGNIGLYSYTDTTASFALDNLSLKQVASVPSPPFTPSVGFDGTVTFDGVTKINTPNYFYLPTGNTESRTPVNNNYGARGVFGGGATPTVVNTIDYITIASIGNAIDFGDLISTRVNFSSLSSSTRGIFAGGFNPALFNTIEYITISSNSNTQDFGDLSIAKRSIGSCSNSTRGVFSGGYTNSPTTTMINVIEYITISSTGNVQDFGDLSSLRAEPSSCSSPTRGIIGGGYQNINIIEYITISSTGNAQDFGDLSVGKQYLTACSNSTRGIFGGGYTDSPTATNTNVIEYITISSTGNTQDFGDLTVARWGVASCSSSIRGVFGGGSTPTQQNVIDYVTILTTSNALDFGDLTAARGRHAACSNGHGGLS